jgi:hypothetical protein
VARLSSASNRFVSFVRTSRELAQLREFPLRGGFLMVAGWHWYRSRRTYEAGDGCDLLQHGSCVMGHKFCTTGVKSASLWMGVPPTNHHENKGRTGGFACLERAREAERIGSGRNCFSTLPPGFCPASARCRINLNNISITVA